MTEEMTQIISATAWGITLVNRGIVPGAVLDGLRGYSDDEVAPIQRLLAEVEQSNSLAFTSLDGLLYGRLVDYVEQTLKIRYLADYDAECYERALLTEERYLCEVA